MKCSHCRADFCWACMRMRTNCQAFQCQNGAPFRNAVPGFGIGEGEGGAGDRRQAPQANDSILTVIDYWLDRSRHNSSMNYWDGMVIVASVLVRHVPPEVLVVLATLIAIRCSDGLSTRMLQGLTTLFRQQRRRPQQEGWEPNGAPVDAVRAANHRQHVGWIEQQMLDEALRRSVEDQ
jgi:hypothetical protein